MNVASPHNDLSGTSTIANTPEIELALSEQNAMAPDNSPVSPLAYDVTVLRELLGTDEPNDEMERQVIGEFVKSWPGILQAIERALIDSDSRALRMQMHTLKSTSATVGAMEIAEITTLQDVRLSVQETVMDALVAILATSFARFESALALHIITAHRTCA